MAQVIRKLLEGSKMPTLVTINNQKYDYDELRNKAYGSIDIYAEKHQLNDKAKKAILNYYDYLFTGLKSGTITLNDLRPRSFNVDPRWESDGTLDSIGHGLLKHDVIDNDRAGATFGTDIIFKLVEKNRVSPYVAPKKKNIDLNTALGQKIKEKFYGNNDDAYSEGWGNASTESRRDMVRAAMAELSFDPNLYEGVEAFNIGRSNFLTALDAGISDDLFTKFNAIGGSGLKQILGIEPEKLEESETPVQKAKTIDELSEEYRLEGISKGILDKDLPAYIESRIQDYEDGIKAMKEQNKAKLQYRDLSTAVEAFRKFSELSNGNRYAIYGKKGLIYQFDSTAPDLDKSLEGQLEDLSLISDEEYHARLKMLRTDIINNTTTNGTSNLSVIREAARSGSLVGTGEYKAILGSEDWKDLTVVAYNPTLKLVRILSMFDFFNIYGDKLSAKFIKKYNENNGVNLPSNFYTLYQELLARIKQQNIPSLKQGGSIEKFYGGGTLYRNVTTSNGTTWYRDIFSQYFPELVKEIDSFTTPEQLDNWINKTNLNQSTHQSLFKGYKINSPVSYDKAVEDYQNGIINDYGYINSQGITNGWKVGRYYRQHSGQHGDGVLDSNGNYTFAADGLGGNETYDRRPLGKREDFSDSDLNYVNSELKKRGVELYDNNGYMNVRRIGSESSSATTSQTTPNLKDLTPVLDENGKLKVDENGNLLYKKEDGSVYSVDPKTGAIATGGDKYNKGTARKILDGVVTTLNNINMADVLATARMIQGLQANNKATAELMKTTAALASPYRQTAIVHGDYNALKTGLQNAGKLNAIAAKSRTNDAGINAGVRLTGAIKGIDEIRKGQIQDSEMYWKTSQNAIETENKNRLIEAEVSNTNRERIAALFNYKLQLLANRITKNFSDVIQPWAMGFEQRMRNVQTAQQNIQIKALEELLKMKYRLRNEELTAELATAYSKFKSEHVGEPDVYEQWISSPEYLRILNQINNLASEFSTEYYTELSKRVSYKPYQKPDWATPGINSDDVLSKKSGGSLSFEERMTLKRADHTYKSIRQANKMTNDNLKEERRERRKAEREMARLTADLVRKAVGLK